MPGCYVQAALAVAAGAGPAGGLFVLLVFLGVLQQPGGMALRALVGQVHVWWGHRVPSPPGSPFVAPAGTSVIGTGLRRRCVLMCDVSGFQVTAAGLRPSNSSSWPS